MTTHEKTVILYKVLQNTRYLHESLGVDIVTIASGKYTEEDVNEVAYIYAAKLAARLTDDEYEAYISYAGFENYRDLINKLSDTALESVMQFSDPQGDILPPEDFTEEDTTLN